jgi:hypothetical protein
MGMTQRGAYLLHDPDRFDRRQLADSGQPVAERFPLHVGHHVEEEPVGLAGVEERQDVWVDEPGRDFDFADKPIRAERCGELGAQDLDRDLTRMLEVAGEVDSRHSALAEFPLDGVTIGEGGT